MTKGKYTKAKAKANRKWDEANKERKQYINQRSVAKSFIRKKATLEDLEALKELIKEKETKLAKKD